MRKTSPAASGRRPTGACPGTRRSRSLAARGASFLALLAAVAVLRPLPASAADNGQFSINPVHSQSFQRTYFTPILDPGMQSADTVVIGNETLKPLTLHLYASDAFTSSAGGFALQPDYKPKKEMGAWIHLPVSQVTIPPRSGDVLKFTYNPPPNVPPGDYTGGIVAEETRGPVNKRGTVRVQSLLAVAVGVFGHVKGPSHPRLAVTGVTIKTNRPFVSQFGGPVDATVTYSITNTGNQNLTPNVAVSLSPLLGSGTTQHTKVALLLPGSTVTLHHTFKSVVPFGKLSTTIVAGSTSASSSGSAGVIVIPWALVVIVVIMLILLLYRRHRRSKRREAGGTEDEPMDPPVEAGVGSGPASSDP